MRHNSQADPSAGWSDPGWSDEIRALRAACDVNGLVAKLGTGFWATSHAREALAEIGTPAVEPLIGVLDHPDSEVRQFAALALADIGDVRAAPALLARFRSLEPADVEGFDYFEWSAMASALGALRAADALEPLVAALDVGDVDVRADAADALGALGDPRAVPALVSALAAGIPAEWSAAAALEAIGGAEAEAALAGYRARVAAEDAEDARLAAESGAPPAPPAAASDALARLQSIGRSASPRQPPPGSGS